MKKIILISIFAIITNSCNMSDYSEKLSGGYTFESESKEDKSIIGKHTIYPSVIEYDFDDDYILACQIVDKSLYLNFLQVDLYSDYWRYNAYFKDSVTEKYNKSRKEIIADSTIYKIFKNRNVTFENSLEDIKKGEEIADSVIKNNPKHKKIFSLKKVYWIIKVKGDVLIGPLSVDEFIATRKQLNISKELKLIK